MIRSGPNAYDCAKNLKLNNKYWGSYCSPVLASARAEYMSDC